jgi:hypothetical protein
MPKSVCFNFNFVSAYSDEKVTHSFRKAEQAKTAHELASRLCSLEHSLVFYTLLAPSPRDSSNINGVQLWYISY